MSCMIPPSRSPDRTFHLRPYPAAQSHCHRQLSSKGELGCAIYPPLRKATGSAGAARQMHRTHTFIEYLHSFTPAALERRDERACVYPRIPIRIRRDRRTECAQCRYPREVAHLARGHSSRISSRARYSCARGGSVRPSPRRSEPLPLVHLILA
ncbi:hypothetical protein BJV78DRAFT_802434 [Lactifluus subvellereus]|nr:hypothetical protein BJV78DRAFT_802434 [Lactifluus subvellereus]